MWNWDFLDRLTTKLGGVWKPFAYSSGDQALDNATNINKDVTVTLQDNKGFIWCGGLYHTSVAALEAGTDVVNGGVLIKFDDAAGFGQLSKNYVMVESLFGRAGLMGGPRELVMPLAIVDTTTFGFNLQNTVAGANTVRLDFIGLKRY